LGIIVVQNDGETSPPQSSGGPAVNTAAEERKRLIDTLIDEASDVDLVCYLAHSGGASLLKDFLQCIRDAEFLSVDDLLHNIGTVRQKKSEALADPLYQVFHRLMNPESIGAVAARMAEARPASVALN
jgi:hypothetical protein